MDRAEVMKELAKEAGKELMKYFGKSEVQYTKAHESDPVTQADLAVNKLLSEAIKKRFPEDGIISEEEKDYKTNSEYVWIIDPLDGTWNFSNHIPNFCTLIAIKKDKQIIAGATYLPITDELYFAQKGKGAYLNNKRITVNGKKQLHGSHGAGKPYSRRQKYKITERLMQATKTKRIHNPHLFSKGIEMAYTASGILDWFASEYAFLWDYAPGHILLKEAGYKISNLNGEKWNLNEHSFFAATPEIFEELTK